MGEATFAKAVIVFVNSLFEGKKIKEYMFLLQSRNYSQHFTFSICYHVIFQMD